MFGAQKDFEARQLDTNACPHDNHDDCSGLGFSVEDPTPQPDPMVNHDHRELLAGLDTYEKV